MTRIVRTVTIDRPLEEVHTAARDPHHWSEWVAGLGDRGAISGTGDVGSFGEFDLLMMGLRFPVRMEVLEDTHGPSGCFCKTEFTGGTSGFSAFTYATRDGQTVVSAEMDYELPGAALGKIADRLIVERLQEHNLEHTLSNLKVYVEAKETARAA